MEEIVVRYIMLSTQQSADSGLEFGRQEDCKDHFFIRVDDPAILDQSGQDLLNLEIGNDRLDVARLFGLPGLFELERRLVRLADAMAGELGSFDRALKTGEHI